MQAFGKVAGAIVISRCCVRLFHIIINIVHSAFAFNWARTCVVAFQAIGRRFYSPFWLVPGSGKEDVRRSLSLTAFSLPHALWSSKKPKILQSSVYVLRSTPTFFRKLCRSPHYHTTDYRTRNSNRILVAHSRAKRKMREELESKAQYVVMYSVLTDFTDIEQLCSCALCANVRMCDTWYVVHQSCIIRTVLELITYELFVRRHLHYVYNVVLKLTYDFWCVDCWCRMSSVVFRLALKCILFLII